MKQKLLIVVVILMAIVSLVYGYSSYASWIDYRRNMSQQELKEEAEKRIDEDAYSLTSSHLDNHLPNQLNNMIVLFLLLFWGLLWTWLSYGVANDRGANGGLWALIGFLLGPIGFILALAAIPKGEAKEVAVALKSEPKKPQIPAKDARFCYGCGNRFHKTAPACPYCGKKA